MIIKKAEFYKSYAKAEDIKNFTYPEIAILGKSNVGKSSLINCLTNQRKLAKISSQPGKTRLVNYFLINDKFYIVDLPGYGYARVSKQEKENWKGLIEGYLKCSDKLKHFLFLVDIRHEPNENDVMMMQFVYYYHIPFTLVATKCDKISRSNWKKNLQTIAKKLGIFSIDDIIAFSSETSYGKNELLEKLDIVFEKGN